MIRIADLGEWVALLEEVPEGEIPGVRIGEQVRLTAPALPGFTIGGRVEAIDLHYTEVEGDIFYTVEIGLEETDPGGFRRRLRWGMTVEVEFTD